MPHTAGRAVNEHGLSRRQLCQFKERLPRRQGGVRQGGGVYRIERLRFGGDIRRGSDHVFGV